MTTAQPRWGLTGVGKSNSPHVNEIIKITTLRQNNNFEGRSNYQVWNNFNKDTGKIPPLPFETRMTTWPEVRSILSNRSVVSTKPHWKQIFCWMHDFVRILYSTPTVSVQFSSVQPSYKSLLVVFSIQNNWN